MNLLITGFPGCGKSTLVNRVVVRAKQEGLKVGGISTPEFRLDSGRRGGFLIRDIATGVEQVMAAIDISSPVKVGRYGVDLNAIRETGVTAIDHATTSTELIVIDEIGKMELAVPEFQRAKICRGLLEISIVENYRRRAAAEFHPQPLHACRALPDELAADLGRTDQRNDPGDPAGNERFADRAGRAAQYVDDSFRKIGLVQHFAERVRGER